MCFSIITQELIQKISLVRRSKTYDKSSDDTNINEENNDVASVNITVEKHENDNNNT